MMKVRITEIEANAAELRSCNSVADGMLAILRNVFAPGYDVESDSEEPDQEEQE